MKLQRTCRQSFFLLALWCLVWLAACVAPRPTAATTALRPVEVVHSPCQRVKAPKHVRKSVYVSLRDASGTVFGLRQLMEQRLSARGYAVTANPSQAGYILQLHVLRAGRDAPESVRAAAPQGYGAKLAAPGDGACVLLVDVLLVLRAAPPRTPRAQREVIAHSSVRTALTRHGERVGAILEGARSWNAALPSLEEGLTRAVLETLLP